MVHHPRAFPILETGGPILASIGAMATVDLAIRLFCLCCAAIPAYCTLRQYLWAKADREKRARL